MTVPEHSGTRVRPRGVLDEAEWDTMIGEWLSGARDASGQWQGEVVGYRDDGTRSSVRSFCDGELEGALLRYHPNGEIARRARYVKGKPDGEFRATKSSGRTPERLRSCCVPPNAWSLVARYARGELLDEWFEDQVGRRLLSDGSVRPDRPASVPGHARFDEGSRRWFEGKSELRQGRQGMWRWWTETGELVEQCEFDAGRPSGAAAMMQMAPGSFEDSRIRSWLGHFAAGERSGRWQFLAAAGTLLYEVDFGTPCTELDFDHSVFGDEARDYAALSSQLLHEGHVGLGLCALVREGARDGDFRALSAGLAAHTVPRSRDASQRRVAELSRQKKQQSLAAWVQTLVDGVEPSVAFSNLAMLLLARPEVGLGFAKAAVALDPEPNRFRLKVALLSFEVGDPVAAEAEATELEKTQPRAAALVRDYSRILFTPLGFPPSAYAAETPPNSELPSQANQPLSRVQSVFEKYALRLQKVRQRLVELRGDPSAWLPVHPSVASASSTTTLERYSFEETDEEDGSETIRVDETLALQGLGTTALLRRARVEWVGLCWLCWGVGLDRVVRPDLLGEREEFAAVLASSLFRVFRISDSVQTRGLRSKRQGLPSTEWEGHDVDTLDPLFCGMARDEAFEMRAVLFFLADEHCRSPWQDDLREA